MEPPLSSLILITTTITFVAISHRLPALCPLPTTGSICTTGPEIKDDQQQDVLAAAKNNPGICKFDYYGNPPILLYSYSYCGPEKYSECSKCLEEAAGVISENCIYKHGAQYTKPEGRCCIRYENYKFCSP